MAKNKQPNPQKRTPAKAAREEPVLPKTRLPEEDEAADGGSGISTDARDDRGWDGDSSEYTPARVQSPDDDTVDGEDGSGAEWTEAGIDGKRRVR